MKTKEAKKKLKEITEQVLCEMLDAETKLAELAHAEWKLLPEDEYTLKGEAVSKRANWFEDASNVLKEARERLQKELEAAR